MARSEPPAWTRPPPKEPAPPTPSEGEAAPKLIGSSALNGGSHSTQHIAFHGGEADIGGEVRARPIGVRYQMNIGRWDVRFRHWRKSGRPRTSRARRRAVIKARDAGGSIRRIAGELRMSTATVQLVLKEDAA